MISSHHHLHGFALLLVDDHPLFRDGLAAALRHRAPGLRIQAVATLNEALATLADDADGFDLVLVDYNLAGLDGLRCARALMQQMPGLGVGLMSGLDDPSLPRRARDAGLMAYFPKTLEIDALMALLERLATGEPVFINSPTQPTSMLRPEPNAPQQLGLTQRQIDVLQHLANGSSNKEIARAIGISPATVKNHLESIFTRLGANNRTQAVSLAQSSLGEANPKA